MAFPILNHYGRMRSSGEPTPTDASSARINGPQTIKSLYRYYTDVRYLKKHGWDVWVYGRYEQGFPPSLKNPPDIYRTIFTTIYIVGNKSVLSHTTVAVVGSRRASPEALERARKLGEMLASVCPLATGLAKGVDAAAVEGALKAGGWVVGVRPWLFPVSGEYFAEVSRRGCVLSHNLHKLREDASWVDRQFFLRNMLIAMLAKAVVIVEARPGGGTMHMLEVASKRWRPVYVLEPPASEGEAWEAFDEFVGAGAIPVNSPEALVRALNAGEL